LTVELDPPVARWQKELRVTIAGRVSRGPATVVIREAAQPARVTSDADGVFKLPVSLSEGANKIVLFAEGRGPVDEPAAGYQRQIRGHRGSASRSSAVTPSRSMSRSSWSVASTKSTWPA
jgi:hypothetical protein